MPFSFADQLAADASAQISTRDFGEVATYINPMDVPTGIVVVCQGEQLVDSVTATGKIQIRQNLFTITTAALANPQINGKIVYLGETWPVVGFASRDSAAAVLICELPVQGLRTAGTYTAKVNSFSYRRQ